MAHKNPSQTSDFEAVLQVSAMGEDLMIVLSPEVARRLSVREGGVLTASFSEEGVILKNASPPVRRLLELVDRVVAHRKWAVLRVADKA